MKKTGLLLVSLLFLLSLAWPLVVQTAPPRSDCELGDLWFGLRINPSLIDWFNQVAGPNDVAAVTARQVDWLDQITAGQRQVLFASAAEAEAMVPNLVGKIDIVGYDLEHWPATPAEEQADPVAAVQRLQALARQYDLRLMLGPDRRFALEYGAEMAPYADRFSLQLQRMQNKPDALRAFALPLIHDLRQANPALEISAQLRTEGNAQQLLALVDSLKDDIDGLSIIYSPQTVDVAQELVRLLRTCEPSAQPSTTPAPVTATSMPVSPTTTPIPATSTTTAAPATPTPMPTTPAKNTQPSPTSTEIIPPSSTPSSTPEITSAPDTAVPPTLPPPTASATPQPPPDSDAPLSSYTIIAGGLLASFILVGIVVVIVLLRRRKPTDKVT